MKLIASVINLCFNLVLMFICFEKYSSVINLDLFWKHLISYIIKGPAFVELGSDRKCLCVML
jgi:hypothetical protein